MANAFDISKYIIHLANSEDEPDCLSHLRLQKLLYYTQGWSLAVRDKPIFPEEIQAWAHGPVVRALYSTYADFKDCSIPPEKFQGFTLEDDECELVQHVWKSYRPYSAWSLREMTHNEAPWLEARKGLGPADRGDGVISHESMKRFFSELAKR